MARERFKRYEATGISRYRYLELKSLARQYDELRCGRKRADADACALKKICAIEDAARAAGGDIYAWLMRCVTRGETWEKMNPPCGRSQFYKARRLFYIELNKRLP